MTSLYNIHHSIFLIGRLENLVPRTFWVVKEERCKVVKFGEATQHYCESRNSYFVNLKCSRVIVNAKIKIAPFRTVGRIKKACQKKEQK